MNENHLDRALKKIMEFSAYFNQYFQHKEPWKKGIGTASCIYLSVNAVCSLAIALHPFLPKASQEIWKQVGMSGDVSNTSWIEMSKISLKSGHKIGTPEPLFAKIESSVVNEQKAKLGD